MNTIYQFDLSGNLLKVWKSLDEIPFELKEKCDEFYWSLKRKFLYKKGDKTIQVASYLADGTFVKSYINVMEACKELKLKDPSGIFSVIQGYHKLCKNLRWRYFYGDTSNIKPLR